MIKLNQKHLVIDDVRFINFMTLSKIEKADHLALPEQLEHLPPKVNTFLFDFYKSK